MSGLEDGETNRNATLYVMTYLRKLNPCFLSTYIMYHLLHVFCSCSCEVFCFYRAFVKVLHSYCSIKKLLFENRLEDLVIYKAKHCSITWARSSFGAFSFCVTVLDHFQHSETSLDPSKLLLRSIVLTLPKHCLLIRFWFHFEWVKVACECYLWISSINLNII